MKIIIIPSAQSLHSNDYSTILSKQGFSYADTLVSIIDNIKPDVIYCSPFIRAMQTIYPYCIEYNKNIKIECSLSPLERFDSKFQYYPPSHKEYFSYLFDIFDRSYKTNVLPNNIFRNETRNDIGNRLYPFLYSLKKQYGEKNTTIALVTHSDISSFIVTYLQDTPVVVLDGARVSDENSCYEN